MPIRPLPRLHALTDARIRLATGLAARAGAIASLGPAVALVARDHDATGSELVGFADRLVAVAAPADASVIVAGRPDVAALAGAQGVHLRADDLTPADARRVLPEGWIGRSVHTLYGAETAREEGADYLVVGNVWATASHPGRLGTGLGLVEEIARLGTPVIAIGGVTPERAASARDAGAWGVAAIRALWDAAEPGEAAAALLSPWTTG